MVTYNKRPGFAREEAVGGTPLTYFKSGTITSIDDQVVLEAPGSGSATVVIKGTFTGTLQAVGSSTEDYATKGGRLLFQSGVGSTGSNKVVGDGTAINKEFRIVSGGRYIIIEPTAWTSGSATVEVYASQAASTIFINGPVHGADEEATRNSRGFIASSGVQAVPSGNVLVTTLKNPADSGLNIFIERRSFGNTNALTDANLEFIGYGNPTYEPLNGSGFGTNRKSGQAVSVGEFKFETRTLTGLVMGGFRGVNTILPNGTTYDLDFTFILPPGAGLGLVVEGSGANISKAVRISMGFTWYEEDI